MRLSVLLSVVWCVVVGVAAMPRWAISKQTIEINSAVLGMPSGAWPLVRRGAKGPETYFIPNQIGAIRKLPEPERSALLQLIRERETNLSFLRETSRRFFRQVNSGKLRAVPEYSLDLGETLMAVDFDNLDNENPLSLHEPVLQALPPYSQVVLFTPGAALSKVKARVQALGLERRVRLVVSQEESKSFPSEGVTRWMHDVLHVARDGTHSVLLASLAHKDYNHVSDNDLGYLSRIEDRRHHVLRMPIFLRGGNLAVARAGRTVLLVGSDELKMNQQWFAEAFAFSLAPNAVQAILKAATGVDEVIVLPNSRYFYHLDMFIAPLKDGTVGLLSPIDSDRLLAVDREVLVRARDLLLGRGFQIVPIPTNFDRILRFQSPVNIVPFKDRVTGKQRALVPMFPEPDGQDPLRSLNARALESYRKAGIDPIPVEDRFHSRWGNIHCALVAIK